MTERLIAALACLKTPKVYCPAVSVTFQNAPLIELVAEFRWVSPTALAPAPGANSISGEAGVRSFNSEQFYSEFNVGAAKLGFNHAERLFPAGFPPMLHTIVYRMRRTDGGGGILQVGPGLFSANSLQPYRSWRDFESTVRSGVELVLKTRPELERTAPISDLTLRYLNIFTGDLLRGKSTHEFITDVLGFTIKPPDVLLGLGAEQRAAMPFHLQMLIPIASTSKQLQFEVGDGKALAVGGAVFNMNVREASNLAPDVDAIMRAFGEARQIMHDAFVEMTSSIKEALGPREE